MVLYVDETENDDYFIVTGLLVESEADVSAVYSRFKKRADKHKISPKYKSKLFTEFKSTILDKRFQKIKVIMLEELNAIDYCVIYSCYIKKESILTQENKERVYIQLLTRIVENINFDIDVIFDTFNKKDFEDSIISVISDYEHVNSIESRDSQISPGLQYVDNLCSVYRHHLSGTDENNFYKQIESYVKIV